MAENKLIYSVEVRDKNDKLFINSAGNKVRPFKFEDEEQDENFVALICYDTFTQYKAISGSDNINISVQVRNSLTGSYMTLYSYDGRTGKFTKH